MDKEKAFRGKVLRSNEKKIELLGHYVQIYGGVKVILSKPRTITSC